MLDDKLETLLAVAETRSFTKAARKRSLTQPAVSHHIFQLEKQYRTRLFIREKKEMRLTPEGEIAVEYAKRLKAIHEKMLSDLQEHSRHQTLLRIGVPEECGGVLEVLAGYSRGNERVRMTLVTEGQKKLYDLIAGYELDMAVVEGKRTFPSVTHLLLERDPFLCVLPSAHPLAAKTSVTLAELEGEQMILLPAENSARRRIDAALAEAHEPVGAFRNALEMNRREQILSVVGKGLGLSVLPQSFCAESAARGEVVLRPIENFSPARELNLIFHRDFTNADLAMEFARYYQEHKL